MGDHTKAGQELTGDDSKYGLFKQFLGEQNQSPDIDLETTLGCTVKQVLSMMGDMAKQIPEFTKNTLTVDIITTMIPKDGVELNDVANTVREIAKAHMASGNELPLGTAKMAEQLNQMSNEELISKLQEHLRENGMESTAANMSDGNISRLDVAIALVQWGHAQNAQNANQTTYVDSKLPYEIEAATKVNDLNTDDLSLQPNYTTVFQIDSGLAGVPGDPYLLQGLVLAEHYMDKKLVEIAAQIEEEAPEMVKKFDAAAAREGINLESCPQISTDGPQFKAFGD